MRLDGGATTPDAVNNGPASPVLAQCHIPNAIGLKIALISDAQPYRGQLRKAASTLGGHMDCKSC